MNFNFNSQPEYKLHTSLAEEMIRLYGVLIKLLVVTKINEDVNVFGDYSHLKSDNTKIHDIFMLPENTEDWDQGDYGITGFGLINTNNVNLFVAKSSFEGILEPQNIVGNILVFPNNKVMEITNIELTVPGVNNLFTYNDQKSVYTLTCRPYDFKLVNEIDNTDMSVDDIPYETLDNYFNELISDADAQDVEIKEKPQVISVDSTTPVNTKVEKPIVDKSEESVWGEFD